MFFKTMRAYFQLTVSLLRMQFHVLRGIWKISRLERAPVTVFGGHLLKRDSIYISQASQLAQKLASNGIPVLTGGGPGIMEAASCGALKIHKGVITTIGISVEGLETGIETSACPRTVLEMDNFAARKWLLTRYSFGFIVFPGGFGTLDELMELLTLIQTKKHPKVPIILIGRDYWRPFLLWVQESALKQGLIAPEDEQLFTITDSIDETYRILKAHYSNKTFSIFES